MQYATLGVPVVVINTLQMQFLNHLLHGNVARQIPDRSANRRANIGVPENAVQYDVEIAVRQRFVIFLKVRQNKLTVIIQAAHIRCNRSAIGYKHQTAQCVFHKPQMHKKRISGIADYLSGKLIGSLHFFQHIVQSQFFIGFVHIFTSCLFVICFPVSPKSQPELLGNLRIRPDLVFMVNQGQIDFLLFGVNGILDKLVYVFLGD